MKRQAMTQSKGHNVNRRREYRRPFSIGRLTGGIFAVVVILACSFAFGSFFSSAHSNEQAEYEGYKYYKSIEIKKGDSLWSIAETYMNEKYNSIHEYIDELASINNMGADNLDDIQEGDYLMVAYYDKEYR